MYDICTNLIEIEYPDYSSVNKLISQTISSLTSSMRFRGTLNISLDDFLMNVIPFKQLNYLIPSYAPFYKYDTTLNQFTSVN